MTGELDQTGDTVVSRVTSNAVLARDAALIAETMGHDGRTKAIPVSNHETALQVATVLNRLDGAGLAGLTKPNFHARVVAQPKSHAQRPAVVAAGIKPMSLGS